MAVLNTEHRLKKELTLIHAYTIATGATIASGFFLLPGLAFAQAGPAMIISYLVAAIPIIPALFSQAELSTAMPRAGGVYFFLDRSMGPLMGTIGGIGTWLALVLKTSFALIGIGTYLNLVFNDFSMLLFAIGFALIFGLLNLFGIKKSGGFQTVLVFCLLVILVWFNIIGLPEIDFTKLKLVFSGEYNTILETAGLVYVSYVGLSKIASVSEEIKNPEKTIPLAMFLALGTAILIYTLGTIVMTGIIPANDFSNNLTPVATAANLLVGRWGSVLMTLAAILAFLSVVNVGILSASRYPLAMSRDHLIPSIFKTLSKNKIPQNAIIFTVLMIIIILLSFDITKIAKLAGAFQLILFSLCCLAVIVMRESKLDSYDPGFRSPLYPWMQIVGVISPFWLIVEMGPVAILFSVGLFVVGIFWYYYYGKDRVVRDGAIYHMFARLGEKRFEGLDAELRGILKEKGLRDKDPFDAVIASASIIDVIEKKEFEEIVEMASQKFAKIFKIDVPFLKKSFLDGTLVGATPVSNHAALPHMRLANIGNAELIMVRVKHGISVKINDNLENSPFLLSNEKIFAFFFLVSPEENPSQHLRILAQIASHVDDVRFIKKWSAAVNEQEIKELLLRDDRFLRLHLRPGSKAEELAGIAIKRLNLPEECLIAIIHRAGEIIVPHGNILLALDDHLTIIGYPEGIKKLYDTYDIILD